MTDDYREQIKAAVLDASFVRLTLNGTIREGMLWRRVVVRPVLLKNRPHLQVSHFDAKRDISKNYPLSEAEAKLDELLSLPFHSLYLTSTSEEWHIQISKKGKAALHRKPVSQHRQPEVHHDAEKEQPIPPDPGDAFLHKIGLMTGDGRIKAGMQDKFAQINEFLRLLDHTHALDDFDHTPIRILDCGCGSAHLSFALYHYLNHLRGIPAALEGVDVNAALMDKGNALSRALGAGDACFFARAIIQHQPESPPDIVIALHACDTATDEALALGVRSGAKIIMAAPCCHHDLNAQLEVREPFQAVMRHGILKERFADILTDSLRALILRMAGYKTDVIEFVSSEHTGRNLMIRAVKKLPPGDPAFTQEYAALKAFWGVTPYLEKLLGEGVLG